MSPAQLILAILLAITACLYYFYKNRKSSNQPPGPWNLPILGYLHMLDPQQPYLTLAKLAQKYGPIFRLKLGVINTVVIADAALLRKVLIKGGALGRPPIEIMQLICQKKGVVFSEGNLWKDQRKFVETFLRSFGAVKVSSKKKIIEDLILENVDDFVQSTGGVFDPSEKVEQFVSAISGTLLLGADCSTQDEAWKLLIHNTNRVAKLAALAGPLNFLPFLRFLPMFRHTMAEITDRLQTIHEMHLEMINNSKTTFDVNNPPSNLVHAFLSQMSKTNDEEIYNMEQLRFLVIDLFGASIETTINSILWGIFLLAAHQDVQETCRQELLQVLQGNTPRTSDLPNLPYTEATLAEIARFRTLVPLGFPHYALTDVQIDDYTIEEGTMIMPLLWAIHMDPKTWKSPEEFSPERFLNDEGKFYEPEAFVPFQAGKRVCLGSELAKMENFLFFATVLQRFKIGAGGSGKVDLSAECALTLMPKPQKVVFVKL